jgi:hypothetical protein
MEITIENLRHDDILTTDRDTYKIIHIYGFKRCVFVERDCSHLGKYCESWAYNVEDGKIFSGLKFTSWKRGDKELLGATV